ncbi:hypothetical protein [Streptomyces sp. NPDC057302]|uniref:hypothetical protein n=1 Tax=Streptomyces sp. NPDC057302 TaxID=3346094 RepID=UPI00362EF6C1
MITPLDEHINDPGDPHAAAKYAKRTELANLVTTEKLEALLAQFAKKSDLPDVSGLAKKTDLDAYTKLTALADYAKKADLPDVSGLAKKSEIPDVSGLAKRTELDAYAKAASLADYAKVSALAAYAKSADVSAQIVKALQSPLAHIAVSAPRTALVVDEWTNLALTKIAATDGFSLVSADGIKVDKAGIYLLVGALHVNNMDSLCKYYGQWSKNGVDPLEGLYGGQAASAGEGYSGLVSPSYPVRLAAGDVLRLQATQQKLSKTGPAPKAVLYQAQAAVIRLAVLEEDQAA